MYFDTDTATIMHRGIDGCNFHVWSDAHGNLQLRCYTINATCWVLAPKATFDAFVAMTCNGAKSVCFSMSVSCAEIDVELDEVAIFDLTCRTFEKPYYLLVPSDFARGIAKKLEPLGLLVTIEGFSDQTGYGEIRGPFFLSELR